jgi:hypothetical protein
MSFKIILSSQGTNLLTGKRSLEKVVTHRLQGKDCKKRLMKHMSAVGSFVLFALKLTMKRTSVIVTTANNGSALSAKGFASVRDA